MDCNHCDKPAIYNGRCTEHHCEYVEQTVKQTIEEYSLFTKENKLCIAVSGGKDSQVVLHILNSLGYNCEGLLIDEGIDGYRLENIENMQQFCDERNIKLKQINFTKEVGTTLDNVASELNRPPCSACGAWRRQLLNKHAEGYDYIITGHNLDDETQAHIMNLLAGHLERSARIGPKTQGNGFIVRIKPLYFLSEKDIRLYTLVKQFTVDEMDCPYAKSSLRFAVRDMLNECEAAHPGTKRNVLDTFLEANLPAPHIEKQACASCGQPCIGTTCLACQLKKKFVSESIDFL